MKSEHHLKRLQSKVALARFEAVGAAYLRWAFSKPTHFQIISRRILIDWERSTSLRGDNKLIRSLMEEALVDAQRSDLLRSVDIADTQVAGRALVYGLAGMFIDGHFSQRALLGVPAEQTAQHVLKEFVALLRIPERPRGMRS